MPFCPCHQLDLYMMTFLNFVIVTKCHIDIQMKLSLVVISLFVNRGSGKPFQILHQNCCLVFQKFVMTMPVYACIILDDICHLHKQIRISSHHNYYQYPTRNNHMKPLNKSLL